MQQLVHFARLVSMNPGDAARLHTRAALQAGATLIDLAGALVTCGIPAYGLAIAVISEIASQPGRSPSSPGAGDRQ